MIPRRTMVQDKPTFKINLDLIIGAACSLASLIGAFYLLYKLFGSWIALLFCSILECSRVFYMKKWRTKVRAAVVIYFFISVIILGINIAAFDNWLETRAAKKNEPVNAMIDAAINAEAARKIREIKEEWMPLINKARSNWSQNRLIQAMKNTNGWKRSTHERKNEYLEFTAVMNRLIQEVNRAADALRGHRTPETIRDLVRKYELKAKIESQVGYFHIYGTDDSTGIFVLSVLIALALEVLIFFSFGSGFDVVKGGISIGPKNHTTPHVVNPNGNVVECGVNKDEMVKVVKWVMMAMEGEGQNRLDRKERPGFRMVKEIVEKRSKK